MNATTCRACGHDYDDHGRRGGRCSHETHTRQTIVHENPDDGIEIRQSWDRCDCRYFVGAFIPA